MFSPTKRALRYARAWMYGPVRLDEVEITVDRGDRVVPATVLRPAAWRDGLPTWVALHGMTVAGREHVQLSRFARTLASSGAVVVLPEVPEWRALDLLPLLAAPTVRASIDGARRLAWGEERFGVIGFSFGAPHAIACSSDPGVSDDIASAAGFGGYCDIEGTVAHLMGGSAAQMSGSRPEELPDPYGRWIVAANFLPHVDVPGGEEVGAAARALAEHAATLETPAWEADCEDVRQRLRNGLVEAHRGLFDLVAPPSGELPPAEGLELAARLVEASRRVVPSIDPRAALGRVQTPTHVLHGRFDRLIPSGEATKIRQALPPGTPARVTVTSLFGHSGQDAIAVGTLVRETPRFAGALRALLGSL